MVLITVDSLRADAIGPYSDEYRTPSLERLAERGTVFEHAFATGNWTPFSFPGLLASRPVFADSGAIGVTESETLAEVLADAGFETGGFNAANGFLTDHWGYDDGFGEFESFVADAGSLYGRYLAAHPTVEAWLQLASSPVRRLLSRARGGDDDRPFMDASRMLDVEKHATSFIEGREEPFFLWIHYMDPHTPYAPAPRHFREVSSAPLGTPQMLLAHARAGLGRDVGERTLADLRTLYQATVRQVDASIGRVLEALSESGAREETAVVVAGDHGEEFQDHGHLAHYPKLYDELLHVPLLVDAPDSDARRIEGAVGLDAVPPTVCELLGVPSPATWAGDSLVESVRSGDRPAEEPVLSVTVRGEEITQQPIPRDLDDGDLLVSARTDEWTYIENTNTETAELYHRPSDPRQQRDLATEPDAEGAAAIERLRPLVRDHARSLERDETAQVSADEAVEKRLEALGYR
ncbi:sulfatase [Halalkalicoccus jeotgali B3]|uniref:Sulfatase n=1 Tax=Halalkalicoccus jeotgali (strain DSM 18796 / CECT 7217 / JCM 14584 / KCTC 4019 / B3) TaxID=795797 RepID=D8J732_HALJB|nr:sulfatase [Halalkalicoccus jeotgali B3]ELY38081.1 sulfatase [Halalkalicoccus jeotgali B3]